MARLTLLLAVFMIVISQTFALSFVQNPLKTLKRHQHWKDKYQDQRDDEDDDSIRPLKAQDLDTFLEVLLDGNKQLGRKEKNRNKNQNNQRTLFDQLTGLGDKDVLVYDPYSYQSIHTKDQKEPLLDMLKSSYDKDMTDEVEDNSPVFVLVKADDSLRDEGDNINDMFASLLKSSSLSQKNRSDGRPDHRYKGFRLKDSYRRAKDSGEMSLGEIEEKRPQTRPRAFGGGRTPIPYLHRGDIYERDN